MYICQLHELLSLFSCCDGDCTDEQLHRATRFELDLLEGIWSQYIALDIDAVVHFLAADCPRQFTEFGDTLLELALTRWVCPEGDRAVGADGILGVFG